MIFVTGCLDMD